MGRDDGAALLGHVERVRRRIEEWRSTRGGGSAMDETLWDEAVALAGRYGVYAISRSLRVDYGALKRRLDPRGPVADEPGESGAPTFVEVRGEELVSRPAAAGTELELSRADGARLVMRLGARESLDLVALAAMFWRGAAS
jgi:hypothetical protein